MSAAAPTDAPAARPARRFAPTGRVASDVRVMLASWAVLLLLAAVWAVSNPLMASPDEPAHVVKAASVVRGQLVGPDAQGGSAVEVPYFYNLTTAYPICYQFDATATGVCEPQVTEPLDEIVPAVTPAGRYNPLYYAVVGLPTFLPPGDGVLYGMRLLSALLCTFLLATGLRALAQVPSRAWPVIGAAAALTPMTVFLTSTINPAAVEIAAAFALWCQLLVLLRYPDPSRTVARMAWIAVSATFLVNARGLSLLYCAVIVVVAVLASSWRSAVDVLRVRRTWPSFAVIVAASLAAAAWVVRTNSLGSGGELRHPELDFVTAVRESVLLWNAYVTNMVGQFGWMDTQLEPWVHMTFAAGAGLVVLLALAAGTAREGAALVLVGVTTFALPVLIHASQAQYLGLIWQGRYILPVAVGLPVLAGLVLARRLSAVPRELVVPLASLVAAVLAAVQVFALVENLHRYVNGEDSGWVALAPDAWFPPLPLAVVGMLVVVSGVAFAILLVWAAASRAPSPAPGRVTPDQPGGADRPAPAVAPGRTAT